MSLAEQFQGEVDTALNAQQALPVTPPKLPTRAKDSIWAQPIRGLAAGLGDAAASALEMGAGTARTLKSTFMEGQGLPIGPVDTDLSKELRKVARGYRPDPATSGTAEHVVFELSRVIPKAVGYTMALGPAGAAAVLGGDEGLTVADDLRAKGVDVETRTKVGAVAGVAMGAGVALPLAGPTIKATLGLYALGGPGAFVAQQQATRSILEGANYGELAKQYDPLDPTGLVLSALIPAPFAALGIRGNIKARGELAPPAAAPAAPLAPAAPEAPPVHLITPEQVDAVMTHNLALQQDVHEASPPADLEVPTPEAAPTLASPLPVRKGLITDAQVLRDAEIGHRLQARITEDYAGVSREYDAIPDSQGGKVLNTDIARELSPDYLADRSRSAAVHEAASAFIKDRYAAKLAEQPKAGELSVVMFTAGGTGSGKTTAIDAIPEINAMARSAQIIYDTNMNKLGTSVQKIEQALAANKEVQIVLVAREPVDALVNGALTRATRQEKEFGTGRTVPIEEHIKTHLGSLETIKQLAEIYGKDPRIEIRVVDNSLGKGNATEKTLGWLSELHYNNVEQRVRAALEAERESGRISPATYRGFAGKDAPARAAEGDRRVAGQVRPGVREGAEPRGDQGLEPGQVTDEAPGREVKPGEPFIVYRLGSSETLAHRNAGNADAVARHLMAAQDDLGAQGSRATTVYAYEVTVDKPFGAYEGLSGGAKGKGQEVGRVARAKEVAYSFPADGYTAKPLGKVSLDQLHGRLRAEGLENFDDAGTDVGARAIREAFSPDAAPAAAPAAEPRGRITEAFTERGQAVAVQFKIVEATDLVTSHGDDLAANPGFPAELQPRDRARAASAEQIHRIENNLRPALLGDSAKASDGAPIVGQDGVVESGNARTIALRRAYSNDKAAAYREWLSEHAAEFGLEAGDVKAMKQPVLVRERLGNEVDRAEFARQANEGALASMSVTEIARSDAARLTDLSGLDTNEDGTINTARSTDFIRRFMRDVVGPNEAGTVMQKGGELSAVGLQRMRNAIFARAYGDAELVALLTESTDSNVRNVMAGMLRAAPDLAKLRDMQDSGARQPADLATPIVQAVRQFSQLRSEGRTVDQFLDQASMFDNGLTPEIESLLRGLQEHSRAPKRVAEMIQGMVADIDSLGDPRQMGMFASTPAADLIGQVARRAGGLDIDGLITDAQALLGDGTAADSLARAKAEGREVTPELNNAVIAAEEFKDRLGDLGAHVKALEAENPKAKPFDLIAEAVDRLRANEPIEAIKAPDGEEQVSMLSRIAQVETEFPDMVVRTADDGTPVTVKDELARIRQEAADGTDAELGSNDAGLLQVAADCALSLGS